MNEPCSLCQKNLACCRASFQLRDDRWFRLTFLVCDDCHRPPDEQAMIGFGENLLVYLREQFRRRVNIVESAEQAYDRATIELRAWISRYAGKVDGDKLVSLLQGGVIRILKQNGVSKERYLDQSAVAWDAVEQRNIHGN